MEASQLLILFCLLISALLRLLPLASAEFVARLYQDPGHKGYYADIYQPDKGGCLNLGQIRLKHPGRSYISIPADQAVQSVVTYGTCFVLFELSDCKGNLFRPEHPFGPSCAYNFSKPDCHYARKARSIKGCANLCFARHKRQTDPFQWPPLPATPFQPRRVAYKFNGGIEVGSNTAEVQITRVRGLDVPQQITAEFRGRNVRYQRTNFPNDQGTTTRWHMMNPIYVSRQAKKLNDEKGHLLASCLGGEGVWWNLIPMAHPVNSGSGQQLSWRTVEAAILQHLIVDCHDLRWRIQVEYGPDHDPFATRPVRLYLTLQLRTYNNRVRNVIFIFYNDWSARAFVYHEGFVHTPSRLQPLADAVQQRIVPAPQPLYDADEMDWQDIPPPAEGGHHIPGHPHPPMAVPPPFDEEEPMDWEPSFYLPDPAPLRPYDPNTMDWSHRKKREAKERGRGL